MEHWERTLGCSLAKTVYAQRQAEARRRKPMTTKNAENSEKPQAAVASSDWLADSYRRAVDLHAEFGNVQWSRSMTRRDMREIGKLHSRAMNLMNTLYHATQANDRGQARRDNL